MLSQAFNDEQIKELNSKEKRGRRGRSKKKGHEQ